MSGPSTIHPNVIRIDGYLFQIVACCSMTDEQAGKIAYHFYRNNKLKKKDKGKTFQVVTIHDQESLEQL